MVGTYNVRVNILGEGNPQRKAYENDNLKRYDVSIVFGKTTTSNLRCE